MKLELDTTSLPDSILEQFGVISRKCLQGSEMIKDWGLETKETSKQRWRIPHIKECPVCCAETLENMFYRIRIGRAVACNKD